MYKNKEATDYATGAYYSLLSQYRGHPLLEGGVKLDLHIYFPTKRKRDIDNPLKLLLDVLVGVVYIDDSQVMELHVHKGYDPSNPRVEVIPTAI